MIDDELVDLVDLVYALGEAMLRWFAVVDGKDGDFELVGPLAGVALHCATWKSYKTAAVEMEDYALELVM